VSWDSAPDDAVAYVYFGHVNIDFDGSPTAYGPPGIQPPPDDDLQNAWDDDSGWFGVVALRMNDAAVVSGDAKIDARGSLEHGGKYPVVQQEKNDDPNPGYYVSATPHATGPAWRQDSYVDASRVPFGALSGKLKSLGVALGDFGLAIRHDKELQSGFYFVDVGGNNFALGECSHRVGKDLGGSGRGNAFNNNFPVSFIVFPQSGTQDPSAIVSMSDDQIADAVKAQLKSLASADNAEQLALLMGFNEATPPNRPAGISKLQAYLNDPDNASRPRNYDAVANGLAAWGYELQS
jgi:hypothetical protein